MVSVAFFAYFEQAPASAQKRGELAAQHHAALAIAAISQLQMMFNKVFEKFANVACVIQITVSKAFRFICTKIFAQQTAALGLPPSFI